MDTFKLPNLGAPPEFNTLLFLAWVQYFAEQRLGSQQRSARAEANGSESFHFGDPAKSYFSLEGLPNGDWNVKASQGIAEEDIDAIVKEARRRHGSGDFGGDIVYQTSMRAQAFNMNTD